MTDRPRLDVSAIRDRLRVPGEFPAEVVAAAESAARREPGRSPDGVARADLRAVPFVTIDPEGSRDLDQAFHAEAGGALRVRYAIADVAHFVDRGGVIEAEAWRRGLTYYTPDGPVPLYPPALGAGAASLLPGVDRPAVVFTLEVAADGTDRLASVERAVVRSRAQLTYAAVSAHLRAGEPGPLGGHEWSPAIRLLGEIGRARQRLEAERGSVSLAIQEQHVERWAAALSGYRLTLRSPDDVEGWNAQVSLMTGMAAARLMAERGVGLLRVLGPPREDRIRALRLTAAALGVPWDPWVSYAAFIRSLDPANPIHTAILFHAAGAMGGAGYRAFRGTPGGDLRHSAIAAHYAHVTAPLRRLADRYALDLVVGLAAGRMPGPGAYERLEELAPLMDAAERRAHDLEAAVVDAAEAVLLADSVGRVFDATVVRLRDRGATVQLAEPPVRAEVPARAFAPGGPPPAVAAGGSALEWPGGSVALGDRVRVRLVSADAAMGAVAFEPARVGPAG